jgi:predicted MFS family arabinose efflux permease
LLGGILVQADLLGLGWRPVFGVNVALGLAALAGAAAWLPESRAGTGTHLDLPGMALLAAALGLLLYPLARAPQDGWSWPDAALLAAGAVTLAVFAAWQWLRRDRHPLVPVRLFTRRGLAGGTAAQLALYAGVTGFFLVFALTLESGYRFAPLHAGLAFLPFSAGIAAASAVSGQLAPRLGRRLIMAGALAMAAGMAGLLAAVRSAGPVPGTWPLIPGLLLAGIGMGLAAPTLVGVSLAGIDPRDAGPGSGVVATAGQAGGALGVAVIGTVFFGALHGTTGSASSYTTAFTAALCYETGVFILTALLTLALPRPAATQARTAARGTA